VPIPHQFSAECGSVSGEGLGWGALAGLRPRMTSSPCVSASPSHPRWLHKAHTGWVFYFPSETLFNICVFFIVFSDV